MRDARLPALQSLLRREGALTARAIGTALGISQPTVSRLVAAAGDDIVRIGRARATCYAWARRVGRAGTRWPVYRIGPDAKAQPLGELTALGDGGHRFEPAVAGAMWCRPPFDDGVFPGLPWFLDDQRPQGFLGRAFARRVGERIGAPADLSRWQTDDILLALLHHGDDSPGDLVLGETALQRALQGTLHPADVIAPDARAAAYPARADAALRGEDVGSSAGGEQPKFVAILRLADGGHDEAIVKFSDRAAPGAASRWADLLRCEHLAGTVLRRQGIAAADSELLDADGRVFLQSSRFDRTPMLGRRGVVSLAAVDAAFHGHGRIEWWRYARQLEDDGWLAADQARRLRLLAWFGALIGNNDMHLGNAALMLADDLPLALAPAYDMLPMAFRPASSGEVVDRDVRLPLPPPEHAADWHEAATWAADFWARATDEDTLSAPFRDIAAHMRAQLSQARTRVA
ncbi:type II toxin-antitoxin system HipA family toxin YjjJ [Luteimonas abyssi]|uniref:type II toxin-antitoxin system HipA family toxin YjjJ n=1 Tax=Luteimonas abyssi TaxID=1247514 RepID=UPI000737C2EA|nr:type II toxin-antitoxin system HipA family toxin YjjJ [Luteimonas abyssi]